MIWTSNFLPRRCRVAVGKKELVCVQEALRVVYGLEYPPSSKEVIIWIKSCEDIGIDDPRLEEKVSIVGRTVFENWSRWLHYMDVVERFKREVKQVLLDARAFNMIRTQRRNLRDHKK